MQPFFITCETCQAKLRVGSASAIGQILACPKCQSFIQVVLPDGVSLESLTSPPPPIASNQITPPEIPSATPPENSAAETIPKGSRLPIFIAATALLGVLAVGIFAYWKGKEQPVVQTKAKTNQIDHASQKPNKSAEGPQRPKGEVDEKTDSHNPSVTTENKGAASLPENKNGHSLPELPSLPASSNSDSKAPLPVKEKKEQLSTSESANNQLGKDKIAPVVIPNRPGSTDQKPNAQDSSDNEPRTARTLRPTTDSNAPNSTASPQGTSKRTNLRSKRPKRKLPPDAAKKMQLELAGWSGRSIPLIAMLDDVAMLTEVPVCVDPDALAAAGVSSLQPMTFNFTNTPLIQSLATVLAPLKLACTPRGDYLFITTQTTGYQRVDYLIDDLCQNDNAAEAKKEAEAIEDAVRRMVLPTTWETAGGKAKLKVRGTTCYVLQTPSAHFHVESFLERLRLARGIASRSKRKQGVFTLISPRKLIQPLLAKRTTYTFLDWTPLDQVRRFWQKEMGTAILVDWPALAKQNITPSTKLQCSAVDQPFGEAVRTTLNSLGLTIVVINKNTLLITTPEKAAGRKEIEFLRLDNFVGPSKTHKNIEAFQKALRKEIQSNVGESAAASIQFYYDAPSNMLAVSTTQATHSAITKWLTEKR